MPFDLSKLQAYTETKEKPEKSESWDDLIEAAFKTEPEKGIPQQVTPGSNLPVTSAGQTKNMPDASDSWDDLISAVFKNEPEVNTGSTPEATGLNDLKNRLADFDKSNQTFLNEWDAKEKELEEVKKSFDPTKVNAVLSYLYENGGKRKQLKQEREELLSSIYNHPELIAERKEKAAELEKRMAEVDKLYDGSNVPVLGTGPGAYMMKGKKEQNAEREADRFSRAYKLYENAHDMLLAPSKFDKSNAFLNFAKGSGNVLSDKDFWTGGMSAIARNLDLGSIFKKISENKEGKDFKDLLTPGESSLLDAYYAQVNAQAERAKDLSLGYQAGQGAAQSLEYMAEFLATGGLATAASSGAKKAAMKWIIKHSAPASLKRQALKGAAWGAEAGVGTLARTPLMPSTYVNVTDPTRQFETDEKGNVLQDEAGRPVLKSGWKVFREGFVDSFIENLSEVSGGHIAGTLGVGGKIVGKVVPQGVREAFAKTGDWLAKSKPGEMYKSFSKSPVWKFLKEGGYNGLLEEWGEEWYGAALRSVLTDPSALKDYATLENQLVTVASFLPMSVLGGGVATGQMLKAKGQYKQTLNVLQGLMKDLGYKEEQVAYLTDQIEASDAEKMASTIAPLINTLAGENEEKAGELFAAVADFSRAKGNYHLMNGAYEERMAARKAAEDKRMEEETGGYVNLSTGRVEIVADEEGNTAYVAGESLDGDYKVYILNKGGEKISVSREDFEEVYKIQGSFDKDEFLDTIIMNRDLEEEISEEESRVEDAREIQSEDYAFKVDENTAEAFDSALDDGKYALLKDGRKGLIETTPEGLVADFLDGSRENITEDMIERPISDEEWLTAQQEEVRPEAEENQYVQQPEAEEVVSATSQEALPENVQQSKQIPVTEDGKPDYNAMSPEMFAEEFEKEFGPEDTKAELEKMVTDVEAKIEKLHKKAPTDRNARAENKREILRLTKEKESVLQALERYVTEEKVPEENAEVIADYFAEPEVTEPEKGEVVNEEELKKEMPASSISGTNIEENSETGVKLNPAEAQQEADNYEKGQEKIDGYENKIVKPTADEVLFREKENYTPEENIEEVNRRFNQELEQQIDGKLPKGHVYQLGRPSDFLRKAGIPDLPIEMPASQLAYKSTSGKHDYDLSEVMNLPEAIADPIATFSYGDKGKSQNILTILEHNGENFLVGMFIRPTVKGKVLEVNSIRNVFPKNTDSIVKWVLDGKLTNANKEKLLNFLDQQRTDYADVASVLPDEQVKQGISEVSVATNIIQNFENPTLPEGKILSESNKYTPEERNIIDAAKKEGTYMKALNGKPSNLNEKQWAQVRTQAFKEWFGDWENDSQNASKVVDENGEPLVVYHGTDWNPLSEENGNAVFMKNKRGLWFAGREDRAKGYALARTNGEQGIVIPVFLNIKNPADSEYPNADSNDDWRIYYELGYDGYFSKNGNEFFTLVATSPNQVKSATDNTGVFSKENDDIRFRDVDDINNRFNKELELQIAGTLPKGHVYRLGRPGEALRSAGILDMDIEMPASRLQLKSSKDYRSDHPFDLSEVENLPQALQNPIAVFESETDPRRTVVLTELKNKNENFLAVLDVVRDNKRNEINSVISLYPKNSSVRVGKWFDSRNQKEIGRDLLKWVDKEKALKWLSGHSSNVNAAGLSSKRIANIIQSFKNSTILEGEISAGIDQLSEELGVPVKKVQSRKDLPEGIQRQMKNGRYPGLFDPKAGEVYMVMDEITDIEDAHATMLHEIVGHKGIRGLFGDKIGAFTQRVLDSMPENERELWVKKYNGNEQLAAEEYVARFAEGYENPGVWEKIKAVVRELFRDLGIDLKLSDNDLKYILWKAKNKLKEGDGMLEIAEKIAKDRSVARELWRKEEGGNSIEEVNRRFNEELERYKSGQMGKNEVFHLGKPQGILKDFLPDLDIIMFQRTVKKGIEKKHNVGIEAMLNMPSELCKPIFIFQRDDHTLGILTEMKDQDNRNVCVAIEVKKKIQDGKSFLEVNELTSFHGRRSENVIFPILKNNTLKWVDKEKGLDWISSVNPNESQEISNQDLSSTTNIIQNFENPKLGDEIRFREIIEEEGEKNKEAAERINLLSELQSQLLNERVSAKLIARKLAGYARNAFGKDLVEVMGKKDFDTVVREIERGLLESKLPKESVELTDERKRLIQEYWKNLGDKEISGKAAKRIREIDREVNRMAKEVLWEPMLQIGDIVADLELKRQNERLNRLVNLKVDGMNAQGVSVAKKVDEDTKVMLHFIREHTGKDMSKMIEELKKKRDEAENGDRKFDNKDEATLRAAEALQQFFASDNSHEVIKEYEGRIKELKEDIKKLKGRIEEEKQKENPDKRLLARLRRKVKNKKQEIRYSAFTVIDDRYKLSQKMIKLNDLVEEMIYEGRSSFLDRVNEESIRRAEILREAMRDMDTRTEEEKMNPINREKTRSNKAMDFIRKYPLSPAWSFNYLVKHLSRNAMNGEGEFYDRLFRGEDGLLEASAKEWKGIQKFRAELDEKVKEVFGKKYDYLKVMEESGKMLEGVSLTVDTGTGGEYKFHPTIGQALYITMIDRMPDAAQKLRAYGISDENVMDLRNALPEQYVKFADWVQDDFLTRKREKYNETHVRIFGSSMAEINHYFPLCVQKSDVYQQADLNKPSDEGLPSGITGSIINRKPNWLIPDVHTNAFEVLLDHGKEMEHWNAYTRVVHDLNGVLSSTAFRKMLKDRDENLPERFRSAATIAVGKYRAKDDDWNKLINTVAKGFTAAKINFRVNTAFKQVFSGPAFLAYAADAEYQKRLAHCFMPDMWKENWKWGMENLPVFEKRWKERKVGNEKLEDGTWIDKFTNSKGIKAGMWLNAAIDAMTCVNGARAVYDYKLKQYKNLGMKETEAVRRARIDAELAFNESQQSAEGFMLSKMQKDKTVLVAGLSVFNNSNFLYLRQTLEGIDELRRDMDKEVASRKRLLMKLGVEEKVAEDAALKEVRRMHRTAIAKIGVFGFGLQVIWNLGSKAVPCITALMVLGFGDDDKEREEAKEVLRNAGDEILKSLLIAPVRNLPGGSDIESMLNGFEASFGDLPMFSDLAKLIKMWKKCVDNGELNPTTIYETFRMAGEGVAGVDLDVLANFYLGIEDAVKNGGVRVEDTGLWISAPASQIRELAKRRRTNETLEEYIKRIRDLNVANRLLNRTPAWLKGELKDRYRLTPFQRAKKDVKQDAKRRINQVNRNESLSPAEKKVKRESLRKERDKQMDKLEEKYEVVR